MPATVVIRRGEPRGLSEDPDGVAFDGDLDDLHLRLATHGPYARIQDECGRGGLVARFRLLLFHLVPGGELSVRLPPAGSGFDGARAKLLDLVHTLAALRSGPDLAPPVIERTDTRPQAERDLHSLAASAGDLRVEDDFVVATCEVATLAKVPEERMNDVLRARPDLGRVVERLPATTYGSRGTLVSSAVDESVPAEWSAPELSLREYHGAVAAPRQVVVQGGLALPESFRNPVRPRLRSRWLLDWSPQFVRRPDLAAPAELPGPWFHLDNILRGHFGHALTEQLSHVWGWRRAKERHPDLRAFVFAQPEPVADWELRLLEAAGIPDEDVAVLDEPVEVETLVATTPAYAIGPYIHPAMAETYAAVRRSLLRQAPADERADRLFLTRRSPKRSCTNQDEVEALFADAGFAVVAPEEHDLAEQVAMVDAAHTVAGFAGSAMFHLALTATPKRVAVIGSESYPAANERQICAFAGHDLTLLRSRSHLLTEAFTSESFHSDFTFDFGREGRLLREWLLQ